jgi:ribosomal protein L11 methyltransferase
MSDFKTNGKTTDYSPRPNDRLYIYYMQGRIDSNTFQGGAHFIGNWEEDGFSFLFFCRSAADEIRELMKSRDGLELVDEFQMTYEEWQGISFSSFQAGGLWIVPAWETGGNRTDQTIFLDPGVVFGSGTHPTTQDCLEAVDLVCRRRCIQTVVDLGTGTGLLALAAARRGCAQTLAVDNNLLAVKTTLRNVRRNKLEDRILPIQGNAENFVDCPADLMIANIHYDVMKALVASQGFLQKRFFVLSGLLRSQAKDIEYRLSQYPMKVLNRWSQDGIWHTFVGERCGTKI